MGTIILIRHGQSTWNADRRWQGQADPPLSELGRAQARTAAVTLQERFPALDLAVSSPQQRAAETAAILVGPYADVPLDDTVDGLRERNIGEWSGLTTAEIDERAPRRRTEGWTPAGYESDTDLFERATPALLGVAGARPGTVLAVAHGGVILAIVHALTGDDRRIPNLSGWVGRTDGHTLDLERRIDLLPETVRTGGDSGRV